ncbi:hypothetical protein SMA5143A_3491 [Streptomyces sp. MA5143a]|nr:hypothetical protein SMA5143A_3491 [Streptomyces sp. MA5143a]
MVNLALTACVTLVVGGHSIATTRQRVARAPQTKPARVGARYDPLTGRYLVPNERTFPVCLQGVLGHVPLAEHEAAHYSGRTARLVCR